MALDHAILVSLSERPATGYDLARRFDASIGFFWSATHQQIYRVLARMRDGGWVEATEVAQDGRPDKRVHVVTDAGRAELLAWSREPVGGEPLRSDLAVRVRGLAWTDREAVVAQVAARRAEHAARLAYYEADAARTFPAGPDGLDDAGLGAYLVLRGGIRAEVALLDWCAEMLGLLAGGAAHRPTTSPVTPTAHPATSTTGAPR